MRAILKQLFYITLVSLLPVLALAQKSEKPEKVPADTVKEVNINLNLSELTSDDSVKRQRADSALRAIYNEDNVIQFPNPWKIKSGDDSSWASIQYDDSGWQELKGDSARNNSNFNTICWFRMHFKVSDSLLYVPLAFYMRQFGSASEVYLDGKFLKAYGKVGKDKEKEEAQFSVNPKPFAVVFSETGDHLLAIRYSNFNRASARSSGINLGINFNVSFKLLNQDMDEIASPSQFLPFIFLAAVFITLSIIHLIMFLYYRQKSTNLYYSLYCFGIFTIFFYIYYILTSTDYTAISAISRTARFIAPLLVIPLVAMLHTVFYSRLLKVFWFLMGTYVLAVIGILMHFKEAFTSIVVSILFFVSVVEILRVIVKAIFKRKDGAWIFTLALLLTPILGFVSALLPDQIILSGIKINISTPHIVMYSLVLGLPLSMTLYLARDFARLSKRLKAQLVEITELSERTIDQEKEKKQILQNQKEELEIKVVERTQEVWQQKVLIEVKNKEITESLVYAKRIQSAILPDVKLIYKTLDQSFILYLPKDIVSGDFYGFAQKNNKVIIAAADCTGHGVAGAFMSMIGTSLLNQIINEKNITEPARILDLLNEGIIESLKQRESESNDGMDISICAFDLIHNSVLFAGANRPLWLIRDNILHVYKPSKVPIGGLQVEREEKFSQVEINLIKGDALYLFSDGFADQFGGDRGKKLMTKKFKDALLSIQHLSMHEQEVYLRGLFESWKGDNEQVDDVLVIGIRI